MIPGLNAALPAATFLLLLLLLPLSLSAGLGPAAPGAERELGGSSRLAAGAARVALQYLGFQAGSPGALRVLGQVRKATVKPVKPWQLATGLETVTRTVTLEDVKDFFKFRLLGINVTHYGLRAVLFFLRISSTPDSGHKYYLQFTTEDYKTGEDAGSCLATVLYPKTKLPPVVTIKCTDTKDPKQIQEEDNRLYQKLRHQNKPIIANNIPDSHGNIDPALEPVWALAVAGSGYIMWQKSAENLGYFMAQVKSAKQWIRKDDFIEFDYTVLLHEIPTQRIRGRKMDLEWNLDQLLGLHAKGEQIFKREASAFYRHIKC